MASHVVTPSSHIPDLFDFSTFLNFESPSSSTEAQPVPESLVNDADIFTEAEALVLLEELDSYCQQVFPPVSQASLALPTKGVSLPSPQPPVETPEYSWKSRCEATPAAAIPLPAHITEVKQRAPKPVKWFPCRFPGCTKKFNRFGLLMRHEGCRSRAHMGLKPFECHCGQRFSRSDNWGPHRDSRHMEEEAANEATKRRFDLIHQDINRRNELRKKEMTLEADMMVKSEEDPFNPPRAPRTHGDSHSVPVGAMEAHANTSFSGSTVITAQTPIAALHCDVDHLGSGSSYTSLPPCAPSISMWNPSISGSLSSLAPLVSASQGGARLSNFSSTSKPQEPSPGFPGLRPRLPEFSPAPTSRYDYGFMSVVGGTNNPAFPYGTLASPVSIARAPTYGLRDSSPNIANLPSETSISYSWSPPAPEALRSSRQTNFWSHSSSGDGDVKQTPDHMRWGMQQGAHPMVGLSAKSFSIPHHCASLMPQSLQTERPAMVGTQLRFSNPQHSLQLGLSDENTAPQSGGSQRGPFLNSSVMGTFPNRKLKRGQESMQGPDVFTDVLPPKKMAWGPSRN